MSEIDLRQAIKTQLSEFEPVRLNMSNGSTVDITHPEAILIGPSTCAVLINGAISLISNFHINRVEPLKMARA